MTATDDASDGVQFDQLKGLGPAKATALRRSGIRSWADLAEVLDALGRIKNVDGDRLRTLRDGARRQAAEELQDDAAMLDETAHPFVVKVTALAGGRIARTNITDLRSGSTESMPGLPDSTIIGFIADRVATEAAEDVTGRSAVVAEAPEVDSSSAVPVRGATATSPGPPRTGDRRRQKVEIDAGEVIGGSVRTVIVPWATADLMLVRSQGLSYRAVLTSRPYGLPDQAWQQVATTSGTVVVGTETADLTFEDVDLGSAVHRVRVRGEFTPL